MKTYRIYAENISDLYIDIEAESHLDAMDRAEEIDGGDFTELPCSGYWKIVSAEELPANKIH